MQLRTTQGSHTLPPPPSARVGGCVLVCFRHHQMRYTDDVVGARLGALLLVLLCTEFGRGDRGMGGTAVATGAKAYDVEMSMPATGPALALPTPMRGP